MSEKQKLFEQLKKEQITQGEFERRLDELKQKENISKYVLHHQWYFMNECIIFNFLIRVHSSPILRIEANMY